MQNALFRVKSVVRATYTSAISTGTGDWSVESSQHSAALCVPTEHSKRSMFRNTCAGNTFRISCLSIGQRTLLHFYQHTCEQIFNLFQLLPRFSLNLTLKWCLNLNSKGFIHKIWVCRCSWQNIELDLSISDLWTVQCTRHQTSHCCCHRQQRAQSQCSIFWFYSKLPLSIKKFY